MSVEVRMPPWPFAIPALAFLAYEILRFATTPDAATAMRALMVAILIAGVLRNHRVALSIWALVNVCAALIFGVGLFSNASSGHATALMSAVLMSIAFSNMEYSFFDQSQRDTASSEA
jgi:hypothetical protein